MWLCLENVTIFCWHNLSWLKNTILVPIIRGGVEDTRLAAKDKAKDTKKNPRPRTALPRTDPLEAKDKNARGQGHKRKCSPKKKVFKNFFQAFSSKTRFLKFFSGDLQNFNNSKKMLKNHIKLT